MCYAMEWSLKKENNLHSSSAAVKLCVQRDKENLWLLIVLLIPLNYRGVKDGVIELLKDN